MKLLITGAKGFIGKNLIAELKNQRYLDIFPYDVDSNPELLDIYAKECDFVFHLAGINRPQNPEDYLSGNFGFTSNLLNSLKKHQNKSPIVFTSSIQATLANAYGKSKKAGEDLLFQYGSENNVSVYIYRLPNVFGKWCKPNYNSAIATFCHNIAHDLPIQINDPHVEMKLVYIDDVIASFIDLLKYPQRKTEFGLFENVTPVYTQKLGEIATLIDQFKASRQTLQIPTMGDDFIKKLYATYLSYLPINQFRYPLQMHKDERGSFTEFLKSQERGQVSINISKPHITKGNHWHHTKNEKFLVVSGNGVIRFRRIDADEIIEYYVSGDKLEVIDIPVGYTHSIENLGETDLVTVMWVSEVFNKEKPDTFYLNV